MKLRTSEITELKRDGMGQEATQVVSKGKVPLCQSPEYVKGTGGNATQV
jgi:hypothetical protein